MLFMVMLGFGNELPEFTQERIQRSAFGYKETQAMDTVTANLVNEAVRFRKHVVVSWLQWAQHSVATSSAPRPKQQP